MIAPFLFLLACTGTDPEKKPVNPDDSADSGIRDSGDPDTHGTDDTGDTAPPVVYDPWPFADAVIAYEFGEGAGYGQESFPEVVYGPPEAPGSGGGSLDVLSLGREGMIVLEFRSIDLVDGEGVDLIVFENPFPGWLETGVVGVSSDGKTWLEWPCDAEDADNGYPGCAGVASVYTNSENGIDATDPAAAGGDLYDLADIGVTQARYVRIRDSGANSYDGVSGGFDLDALAAVNAVAR